MVTDFGAKLLAFNGIDRWIGAVHLEGHRVNWRWDDARQTLVES
jgi:hypothetical protein